MLRRGAPSHDVDTLFYDMSASSIVQTQLTSTDVAGSATGSPSSLYACAVTIFDDVSRAEWGHLTLARTARWAERNGYKLHVRPFCGTAVGTWCIPRRVLEVLEEGACSVVLFLDGDAVVSRLSWTLPAPRRPFTFATHDENASTGVVNSGVFLVINSAETRRLMQWWVAYGNRSCSRSASFPEQACAERLRHRFGGQVVDVVGHRALNTPVKISASGSAAAFAQCMADGRNRVCHPLGVRHFCKHHSQSLNATTQCIHRIRRQMFARLAAMP